MYNDTQLKITQLSKADLFSNTGKVYCPIISLVIMRVGCQQAFEESLLRVNEKYEIETKVDSRDEVS